MRYRSVPFLLLLTLLPVITAAQQSFSEIGERIGFGVAFSRGISVTDYNSDGFEDVFIARKNRNNLLFKNTGEGAFEEVSEAAGIWNVGDSNQAVWADYDNDGDIDFYLTTETESENKLYANNGDGTFTDVTENSGLGISDFTTAAIWGDVNGDNLLDLFVFLLMEDDRFFLNNGDGTFSDYTVESGIGMARLSMGATFIDYDNDRDLDLYVAHDGHAGNFLYQNDGNGRFTDVSVSTGILSDSEGMGVSVGDFNNDGWADLYLTNRLENLLFKNNDGQSFTEIGASAGIDDIGMGWGVSWLDFDNDGFLDLYIANDTHYSPEPNVLYRNNGDETFLKVEEEAVASEKGSYATAIGDLNHDGLPDLLMANRGAVDRSEFFINEMANENAWLVLKLKSTTFNRSAIGARLEVTTDKGRHNRYVFSGTGWSADDSKSMLFGLGDATAVESVKIYWPDGREEVLTGFHPNKAYEIDDQGETQELDYSPITLQAGNDPGDDDPIITSLEDEIETILDLKVGPNPFSEELAVNLNMKKLKNVNINILKHDGIFMFKVLDQKLSIGEHHIPLHLAGTAAGVYLLQVQVGGQTHYRKLLKRH